MNRTEIFNYLNNMFDEIQEKMDPEEYSDLQVPPQMFDFLYVLVDGANKYGANTWLIPDTSECKMLRARNAESMRRHLEKNASGRLLDDESGRFHLEHLQCRAAMEATRVKLGLKVE